MTTYRAIIVDDERYARKELLELLSKHKNIEVVGESSNINDAVAKIVELKPDIVFLDIQLIGETGFDLFEKLKPDFYTIFVTAFDNYAIRAFEVNAFDYLLKPVHPDRLRKTISNLDDNIDKKINFIETKLFYDDSIYVTLKNSAKFLPLKNISSICAENEYSKLLLNSGQTVLFHKSLKKWEEKLPDKHFQRIHRSTIININYIDEIKKLPNNTYKVFLKSLDHSFDMSRRYAAKLKHQYNFLLDH